MIALLRTEWGKVLRRPRTWVSLGFVMFIPAVVTIALAANPPDSFEGDRFFYIATQTGLLLPAAVLRVMSRLVLVVVIALYVGDAIAGEASTGNLRYVLLRPLSRGRFLLAKLIVAGSLSLIATVLACATGIVAGGLAFGWKPIESQFFFVDQSVGNLFIHLGMATGYIVYSLAGVAAFGFMVSTMTDSPAAAAGAAVGLAATSQILDEVDSLGAIRDVLPTHRLDAWLGLFWSNRVHPDMYDGLLLQIPYILGFLGFAWWHFRRKDVLA